MGAYSGCNTLPSVSRTGWNGERNQDNRVSRIIKRERILIMVEMKMRRVDLIKELYPEGQ